MAEDCLFLIAVLGRILYRNTFLTNISSNMTRISRDAFDLLIARLSNYKKELKKVRKKY